jgi:hypothetical protein
VRERKPIHSVVDEEVRTGFSWDNKRRLLNHLRAHVHRIFELAL